MALVTLLAASAGYTINSAVKAPSDAFELLNGVQVLRTTDGTAVDLNKQWRGDERCALFFFRSFG